MIRDDSDPAYVKTCLVEFLSTVILDETSADFLAGIEKGQLKLDSVTVDDPFYSGHSLQFFVPVAHYHESEVKWFQQHIVRGFKLMREEGRITDMSVTFKAFPSAIPAVESGLNNTSFKVEHTIAHDELRFRSKSEIAVYDELKRRNVLFFPNPAAVLGRQLPESSEKREPDFLVCHGGKWGILEVSGEPWHSGQISTAKDHDRSRLFQHYGLVCVQHFDANRCRHSPADVVDEFLLLLSKS